VTAPNGGTSCVATAAYAGDANHLASNGTASITITYALCKAERDDSNRDRDDGNQEGRSIPIQVRVCNATGRNISSRSLPVKAISITPSAPLDDSGHANPGNLFRFDDGTYIFNLSTANVAHGDYTLDFTSGNDPTMYHAAFTIRRSERRDPHLPDRTD
jgi:hypothetical protein